MLLYRFLRPGPPLAAYVRHYRSLRGTPPPAPTRSYPDGTIDLIVSFGGAIRQLPQHGGPPVAAPAWAWVVGPGLQTDSYQFCGQVDLINVNIAPGAGMALFGIPPAELLGRWVRLDALWPGQAMAQLADLAPLPPAQRAAGLQVLLARLVDDRHALRPDLQHAVSLIGQSRGTLSIRGLAAEVGVSERQLTRRFQHQVGLSPKGFSRITRLWHVIDQVRAGQRHLATLALEAGYYDQAHLSNDLLALTGLTPATLLRSHQADGFFQDQEQRL